MRPRWSSAILLLATSPALAAPQGKAVEVENIRVGLGDTYKVGTWTPVWVQARAGVEPFEGTMEVVVDDESGTPTAFAQSVRIGAGDSARLVAYTRPGSPSGGLSVRFVKDGKRVAATDLDTISPNKSPTRLFADEIAILTLGKPQGVDLVTGLPGFNGGRAVSAGSSPSASAVEVVRPQGLDGGGLPGRALGYDAYDAVVVDTNDRELMSALAVQGDALKQWVGQGGHVVVAVGANWQSARDSVLGPMLPATLTGTIPISDVRTIESFAGATNQLPVGEGGLTIARLEEDRARAAKVLCATSTTPIVVRGAYGFGRVTLVALDVDGAPFATWPDRGLFWVKALDLRPAASTGGRGQATFTQSTVNDLSGRLREALEQFPGVRLIPFGWVAFFIFIYILLIGPGDYFFLRKVVKRMEFTWITFPLIVLVVSGLAYWAAYKAKGTELRVNQVDVVDVDVPAKLVRGASFVNVFSPQNRDYQVAIVPRPLQGDGPMPPGTETRVSWFAAPDMGLRGMGGGGRALGFGAEGYRYAPDGRAERLEGVRIPIWSTKAFTARWFAPFDGTEPIIESDLTPLGLDRLNGTVTNRLGVPLKGAVLAFNKRVYYNLGTLAPGESKQVELTQDRNLSGHLGDLLPTYYSGMSNRASSTTINRYGLMQAILSRDSDVSGTNPLPSRPLHDLDLTGQLQLDRPMLIAEVDRPATRLDLGPGTTPSKGERTTVIRVILPLKQP